MPARVRVLASIVIVVAACAPAQPGAAVDDAAASDAAPPGSDAAPGPCTTRITYGRAWIHGANHPADDDVADGDVDWDGTCIDDGASSYALLSNGWKPYFAGHAACELALDHAPACASRARCATRVSYGAAWLHPPQHAAQHDDVDGRVFWDGACNAAGADSVAQLSNGWAPHFAGAASCALSMRWTDCGGLYANPVMPRGCADPGVVRDGDRYVMSCTSGNAADAFPIYVSHDLASWTAHGHILPAAARPGWARGDFWAPEIHRVGAGWVAYWSARGADGKLAIGAATAADPLGPYTALAQPLVHDAGVGLIDASEYTAPDGTPYLLWKEDGNAQGQATPIHARALAADGLSLVGARATLVTNDQPWEGNLVEAPWMIAHAGSYYLFYSGNAYYDGRYAIGVARASSPLGPFTKLAQPIVTTGGDWVGPGHCSVVDGSADTYVVYHAWRAGHVNGPGDERLVLVDQVQWQGGWPVVAGAPSSRSRPRP